MRPVKKLGKSAQFWVFDDVTVLCDGCGVWKCASFITTATSRHAIWRLRRRSGDYKRKGISVPRRKGKNLPSFCYPDSRFCNTQTTRSLQVRRHRCVQWTVIHKYIKYRLTKLSNKQLLLKVYFFKSSAWRWLHRNEPKHVAWNVMWNIF